MSPLTGVVFAAALLLGIAGGAKVLAPDGTRVALRTAGLPSSRVAARSLGGAEVILAITSIVVGGVPAAVIVAVAYVGFAGFAELLLRRSRGRASCGCFGGSGAPVSRVHVVIDLVIALAALITLADPVPGVGDLVTDSPWSGLPALALIALLTWLLQVALTDLASLRTAMDPPPPAASISISSRPSTTPEPEAAP